MISFIKPKAQLRQENDLFFDSRRARLLSPDADILPPAERVERIQYYADKPLEWMATYLPEDFTSDFADHHPEMVRHLDIRGRLVVIIIFRNAGKGTILKGYTAHAICYGKEPYLTRMEHDATTAANEILDLVREFQVNPRIISDYGMLCGDMYGMPFRPGAGEVYFHVPILPGIPRDHEFIYVRYIGLDSMMRGTVTLNRKRIGRLIVNDPVKGYIEAHSASHTLKVVHTIKSDAGFAGGSYTEKPISVTVIGTCQARGDVIDALREEPMAKVQALPAIEGEEALIKEFMEAISEDIPNIRAFVDRIEEEEGRNDTQEDHAQYIKEHWETYGRFVEGLHPTWKSRFTLADYVFIAANWGTDTFMQEEQHEMIDSAIQRFLESWFPQYDGTIPDEYAPDIPVTRKDHPLIYAMTVDTAGTPQEGSDPFAIYAGAYHTRLKNLYTKHYWCEQSTPDDLAVKMYEIFWTCFPWYTKTGVTVYLEDTVSYSGIGKAHLDTVRYKKIEEVRDAGEQRIQKAIEDHLSPNDIGRIRAEEKANLENAKRYWIRLPIKMLTPASMGNKLAGIAALRPIVQHRQIWVNPKDSMQTLLVAQFRNHKGKPTHEKLPITHKNEGPDCVRMLWHVLKKVHKITPVFAYGGNTGFDENARQG